MSKGFITSSLFSGSAVYLFSNILAAAIPFALLPVLTRYLTPSEYGQVAIFQALVAGLGAFVGLSVQGAASVRHYDSHTTKNELKFYIGNCFLVVLSTSALVLLAAIPFRRELCNWLSINNEWMLLSVFVSSAAIVIAMRMAQWQIKKQAIIFGVFQVSQSLINMLLSLLLVVYFAQGAAGRIWALVTIPTIFAALALFSLHRDELLGFAWRPEYLREIVSFGMPLIPHAMGLFLLGSVDRFFINKKVGLSQVGVYMVAVQLVSAMGLVFDAINNAYVPWLFERLKRNNVEEKLQIVRWTYGYCLVLSGVAMLAFVVGPPLVILVAGEKYGAATGIIGWLALGQAFHGMYLMVTNYIFYSKRTALLSLSTIIAGLVNIGLLFALIEMMGLKGAAVAYAVAMGFKFVMTWFIANISHPMPWFNLKV